MNEQKTITIGDAIKAQPGLERHEGYRKWLDNDDWIALDRALDYWGFNPTNANGEIPLDPLE